MLFKIWTNSPIVSYFGALCGQVYMLELYQDTLIDLLAPPNVKGAPKPRKLDIKKDSKVRLTSSASIYDRTQYRLRAGVGISLYDH
jgi:hypothetical protein